MRFRYQVVLFRFFIFARKFLLRAPLVGEKPDDRKSRQYIRSISRDAVALKSPPKRSTRPQWAMASWWDTVWREARTTVGRRAKRFAPSSDSPPPLPPRGVGGIVVEEEEGPDGWDVVAVKEERRHLAEVGSGDGTSAYAGSGAYFRAGEPVDEEDEEYRRIWNLPPRSPAAGQRPPPGGRAEPAAAEGASHTATATAEAGGRPGMGWARAGTVAGAKNGPKPLPSPPLGGPRPLCLSLGIKLCHIYGDDGIDLRQHNLSEHAGYDLREPKMTQIRPDPTEWRPRARALQVEPK